MFSNEAGMQRKLSEYANRFGGFGEIVEKHEFRKGEGLERDLIVESYNYCLESLKETDLLAEEENISLFAGEQLKPDFVLFDPGYERFLIVELKNAKNATRQAGTELGAYANAIKNHAPMIADSDIVFIVISTDWPALLKNYLFNEIFWGHKKVLCLRPKFEGGLFLSLECLPPNEFFTSKQSPVFRSNSFSGMQYCIYGKSNSVEDLDGYVFQVKASFERIVRKAQQKNSHGFAFLWKDLRCHTSARYSVTLVDINPFEKFQEGGVGVENVFAYRLYNYISKMEVSGMTGTAIDSMKSGDFFLKSIASPSPEGAYPWRVLKGFMLEASELISFKSFGVVADLYDEYLVKYYECYGPHVQYDNPCVGLSFTEEIIHDDHFDSVML
ncbi:hypothetical protein [Aquipseudomonas campi]